MSRSAWVWIIIILILVGGVWFWWSTSGTSVPTTPPAATATPTSTPEASVPMSATIAYNGSAFTPASVTIKKGGTVTWRNNGSGQMWVASAQHPSHMVYSGTSRQEHCPDTSKTAFDQCASGSEYSFTLDKVGEWGFHDHLNADAFGKVIVVE